MRPTRARRISIVTFNGNERDAIDKLFEELSAERGTSQDQSSTAQRASPWKRTSKEPRKLSRENPGWVIAHEPLVAQGNVIAANATASLLGKSDPPDVLIFYGCAGAIDPSLVGHVFLVGSVVYASLGTVRYLSGAVGREDAGSDDLAGESVTLKSKWLVSRPENGVEPLLKRTFRSAGEDSLLSLPEKTGIPVAHVIATDKVVEVRPMALSPCPGKDWTYAHALAVLNEVHQDESGRGKPDHVPVPVLVEMESYGIAGITDALEMSERVVVIRIVTDSLANHGASDDNQVELLLEGRKAVAVLLQEIIATSATAP